MGSELDYSIITDILHPLATGTMKVRTGLAGDKWTKFAFAKGQCDRNRFHLRF
jgi:hypothetical protein